MSIWDDPDLMMSGDYVKFENIGDTVTGTIITIRARRWDDGKVSPEVLLDVQGEQKTMTAGQYRLKAALSEHRPEPGDVLTVTMTNVEKLAGGKTRKHFAVEVVRGNGKAPAPAAASAPTAEQREAMRLLGMDVPA